MIAGVIINIGEISHIFIAYEIFSILKKIGTICEYISNLRSTLSRLIDRKPWNI